MHIAACSFCFFYRVDDSSPAGIVDEDTRDEKGRMGRGSSLYCRQHDDLVARDAPLRNMSDIVNSRQYRTILIPGSCDSLHPRVGFPGCLEEAGINQVRASM